ncbi:hypothetical protein P872_13635 [Rhodonellum psychrophilum GCM71 = DSM 17998]|uniref:Uncharacterized protein n=2 Tax=Rhodonellum TaxID=336827 RepID=U5BWV2_9BACT|nr:hypothetical protein P872_13635 [Rhodonellum psychrophilum GCM71 = DSM 17998]SDZ24527.1 hypothetical protein SAMN05444412_10892 [Rhodonellum ikkaensis]
MFFSRNFIKNIKAKSDYSTSHKKKRVTQKRATLLKKIKEH